MIRRAVCKYRAVIFHSLVWPSTKQVIVFVPESHVQGWSTRLRITSWFVDSFSSFGLGWTSEGNKRSQIMGYQSQEYYNTDETIVWPSHWRSPDPPLLLYNFRVLREPQGKQIRRSARRKLLKYISATEESFEGSCQLCNFLYMFAERRLIYCCFHEIGLLSFCVHHLGCVGLELLLIGTAYILGLSVPGPA